MSKVTTKSLNWLPSAAGGTTVTPNATAWVNSVWTQLTASTANDIELDSLMVSPGVAAGEFEIDIGIGAIGSEVAIATLKGNAATLTGDGWTMRFPITVNKIPTSTRVSFRMRKVGTSTSLWGVALGYYNSDDSTDTTTQQLTTLPNAAVGVTLTPNGSTWVNSSWVSIGSVSTDILFTGFAYKPGVATQFEMDIGSGPTGSEVVVSTAVGDAITIAGNNYVYLPQPVLIPANQQLNVRSRQTSTTTTAWDVSALYYPAQSLNIGAVGSVKVDTGNLVQGQASASSLTLSNVTVANLPNRALIVQYANHQGGPATSITYGGVNLTQAKTASTAFNETADIWYLLSPTTGSASVVISSAGGSAVMASAFVIYNIDTTQTFATGSNTGSTTPTSVTITAPTAHSIILETTCSEAGQSYVSPQTQLWVQQDQSFENGSGSYFYPISQGTYAMATTLGSGQRWAQVAIAVAPKVMGEDTTVTDFPGYYQDTVATAENITVNVVSGAGFSPNVNDSVTTSENVTVKINTSINVNDKTITTESFNSSLSLDGTSGYVKVPTPTNVISLTNNFTVMGWVNPTGLVGVQRLFGIDRATNGIGWGFGLNGSGLRFTTYTVQDYDSTTITLIAGQRVHIAAKLDSSNNVTFYINGVNKQTITGSVPANANTVDDLRLGAGSNGAVTTVGEFLGGVMGDLRVYNTSLSDAQVTNIYNGTSSDLISNLVGWWPVVEGSGTTIADRSGNGYTGTLSGTTIPTFIQSIRNVDGNVSLADNISVNDSSTTSESLTVQETSYINVNDASTTSESVTVREADNISVNDSSTVVDIPFYPDDTVITGEQVTVAIAVNNSVNVNVNDSSTTSESVTVKENTFINVNDAVTTSESVTLNIPVLINVNDSSTTSENVNINEADSISVSDSSTTSESVTLNIPVLVSVSDSSTTSENVNLNQVDNISVNDSSTTSESTSEIIAINISVNDSTTVSESVVLQEVSYINVNDSTITSESVSLNPVNYISVNDSTTISEFINLNEVDNISVNDSSTVSENINLNEVDNISVNDSSVITDVPSINDLEGGIVVADSTTTSESVSVQINTFINVNDSSATSESVSLSNVNRVSVSDSSTTSENISINQVDNISVSDASTTSESVTIQENTFISVSDSTTISESVTLIESGQNINVSDSITTLESITLNIPVTISVSDSTITSESINLNEVDNISVNDSSTTSENINLNQVDNISVNDSSTTSESVIVLEQNYINVSDSSVVTDVPSINDLEGGIVVADSSTVSESTTVIIPVLISTGDDVTTSESSTVIIPATISVNDSSTTSEGININVPVVINVNDSITVSENLSVAEPGLQLPVGDDSTAGEFIEVEIIDNISVSDSSTTNENVNLNQVDNISVNDSSTTSESSIVRSALNINVSDSSVVTDHFSSFFPILDVNVFDAISQGLPRIILIDGELALHLGGIIYTRI